MADQEEEMILEKWSRAIKQRDKVCVECGSDKKLRSHHIHNKALGGKNTMSNGQTLCNECHKAKHIGKMSGVWIGIQNGHRRYCAPVPIQLRLLHAKWSKPRLAKVEIEFDEDVLAKIKEAARKDGRQVSNFINWRLALAFGLIKRKHWPADFNESLLLVRKARRRIIRVSPLRLL